MLDPNREWKQRPVGWEWGENEIKLFFKYPPEDGSILLQHAVNVIIAQQKVIEKLEQKTDIEELEEEIRNLQSRIDQALEVLS